MARQKQEAYTILETVHYKHELATFSFEHFTGLLTRAYNDLQRYGEAVLESKKVRDLLNAITDPKLDAAKQAVRIHPQYKNDFAMAINFIAEIVKPINKSRTRSIVDVNTDRKWNGQEGRTHGARGARYHRGGRASHSVNGYHNQHNPHHGGRGHGGGRGRGSFHRGGCFQGGCGYRGRGRTDTSYIPPSEWESMTYNEQQSILSARGTLRHSVQEVSITGYPDQISVIMTPMQQQQQHSAQVSQVSQRAVNQNTNATAGSFAGHAAYRE